MKKRYILNNIGLKKQRFLFLPKICETRQAYFKKETIFFYTLFKNKILKVSKKIRKNFTVKNIWTMLISLEYLMLNHSYTGYYKYNLEIFFSNPCFLLYCYFQLKRKKLYFIKNFSKINIILPSIFLLAKKLNFSRISMFQDNISIFKREKKEISIISINFLIVQKALLIFLEPVFENQFSKYSHGFQKKKNCHTCLKMIFFD